ncbi:NAD(P)-binding protein [Cucurbitaria berberidis CBS 394.84]|uniref:NAD(P)-binding protein n=1 Tax=Cucurbitaria berberidis CBS 394.84 TaxID=1168544 RepID=A0A9P4L559_9PLEO|nr:NAD(P)-binding protein [Cucurbitaria berberidis CBS 394.84]KAF1841643.1 NAD(P)-binding protein [Cucurbitaria berberidis CBS 394.84]
MPFNDKIITLITGANGGIGFELASQLLADGKNFVLLGSRSQEKGEAAVQELKKRSLPGTVELVQVDVSDEQSIAKAAGEVEEKYSRIDALVNNAAIAGETPPTHSLPRRLTAAFLTNSTGPAIVVESFAPLLSKSTAKTPRIVNVTSGAGSISLRLDSENPHQQMKVVPYRMSKAALNMLTACQAYEYGPLGWKVFAFCPGFTASGLSDMNKEELGAKPTREGASPIVDILAGKRDGEHGGFLHAGGQHPW